MNQKPNIWVFSLEPLESRYTIQWHTGIPDVLRRDYGDRFDIIQIDGEQKNTKVTEGAFLNFSDTNYWKSSQLLRFLEFHNAGMTTPNDRFLFTDFWNPTIIQIKYMKDLLGFDWQLHGIAHAGSYDPQDFLGRLVQDKRWSLNFERSLFWALDKLHFATNFHIRMFVQTVLEVDEVTYDSQQIPADIVQRICRSGQPHDRLMEHLEPFKNTPKRDLVLFPHRVAPEKQPEIFRDLATHLPEFEFVVCQDKQLSKDEYHQLLGESKIVFSANLQETLGISAMEAVMVNSLPILPDRLSYTEMYYSAFRYNDEWTRDWDSYVKHRDELVKFIRETMKNYDSLSHLLPLQREWLTRDYLRATAMFEELTK